MSELPWIVVVLAAVSLGVLGWVAVGLRRRLEALKERERRLEEQAGQLQQQASQLAEARDQAVETAQLKSHFLATMSHELRTPLNAVLGMASLLGETELTEEQRDYVGTIEGGSRALLTLIGDILDLSKLEAGKLEPESVIVDVHDCAEQALGLVSAQAHAKKLELVYAPTPDAPSHLVSDPGRLQQVLINLLSNAVKFTDEGEVTLEVRRGEGEVVFAVRDSGVGISPDLLPQLFQPFQQIDASSTRRHGGTGLGLAISKAIVELLGGSLGVESVAGEGSTFSFRLPAPAEVRPLSRPSLPGEREVRALVLDPSASSRAAIASLLEGQGGIVVQVCTSAAEFFAALGSSPIVDVLIVDPRVSSEGAVDLLQQLSTERQLPPVLMLYPRGAADRATVEGFFASHLRHPGCASLVKPLRPRPFLAAFAAAVRKQPAGRPVSTRSAIEGEPRRRLRVLVAEDNPVNQRVVRTMLTKLGHEVTVVDNGQLALDATARHNFDVVVLDVHMPVLDGLAAATRLRETIPRATRPRIIGLTASALPGDREACLAAGMDVFLPKPIQLPDLVRALADAGVVASPPPSTDTDADRSSMDVLDPHIIDQLRFRMPPPALHEHIERSIGQSGTSIEHIEQAFAARDLATVEAESLALRERSASLGLVRLYALLIKVERAAREGRLDALSPTLARLPVEGERAYAALRRVAGATLAPPPHGSGVRTSRSDDSFKSPVSSGGR